jgi:hypothetical protein
MQARAVDSERGTNLALFECIGSENLKPINGKRRVTGRKQKSVGNSASA